MENPQYALSWSEFIQDSHFELVEYEQLYAREVTGEIEKGGGSCLQGVGPSFPTYCLCCLRRLKPPKLLGFSFHASQMARLDYMVSNVLSTVCGPMPA